jgi:hypothetical protein
MPRRLSVWISCVEPAHDPGSQACDGEHQHGNQAHGPLGSKQHDGGSQSADQHAGSSGHRRPHVARHAGCLRAGVLAWNAGRSCQLGPDRLPGARDRFTRWGRAIG